MPQDATLHVMQALLVWVQGLMVDRGVSRVVLRVLEHPLHANDN